MKFLVTGSNGFVGKHLIDKLSREGHETYGLGGKSSSGDDVANGYVDDRYWYGHDNNALLYDIIKKEQFDGVFHGAALTHPPTSFKKQKKYFIVNALYTIDLCSTIEKYSPNCNLCHISTCECYGVTKGDKKIDESFPLKPTNPYAVSKAAADMYVQERLRNGFIKGFITRGFSQTGPGRPSNYSISSDAKQIARIKLGDQDRREGGPVIKVGNLKSKRVVMDVRDVVDVYYKLMIKACNDEINNEIYNIGGDDLREIGWYLDKMLELTNLKGLVKTEIDPNLFRPIDIPVQWPNSTKVRKLLQWKPQIPIEKTLEDLINWWKEEIMNEC